MGGTSLSAARAFANGDGAAAFGLLKSSNMALSAFPFRQKDTKFCTMLATEANSAFLLIPIVTC